MQPHVPRPFMTKLYKKFGKKAQKKLKQKAKGKGKMVIKYRSKKHGTMKVCGTQSITVYTEYTCNLSLIIVQLDLHLQY